VKLSNKLLVHEHDKPENNYQNIEGKTNNNYTFETVPCQFKKKQYMYYVLLSI